jgi:hypothetical protein
MSVKPMKPMKSVKETIKEIACVCISEKKTSEICALCKGVDMNEVRRGGIPTNPEDDDEKEEE